MARPIRERRAAIQEYVGSHYSDDGSQHDAPTNFLELLVHTLLVNLSSGEIGVTVTTNKPDLKRQAMIDEAAVQNMVHVSNLREALGEIVLEAIFSVGVAKVGMCAYESGDQNWREGIGRPFCWGVTLDDLIIDMAARSWRNYDFIGNRYLAPLEWARANEGWNPSARATLKPLVDRTQTHEGEQRSESIGRSGDSYADHYREVCELEDIWCPREKVFVTKAVGSNLYLDQREWNGPLGGPYEVLSFHDVPGQLLPLSPVANLRALNALLNSVFNKIADQAVSQKDIILARMGGSEDSNRIVNAKDGDVINCDDPRNAQQFSMGGANNVNVAVFTLCKMLFPYLAGGMDSFGGLAPQADTATQEQMMFSTASRKIQGMQHRVVEFTGRVVRTFAWYARMDPFYDPVLVRSIPGTDMDVPLSFAFEERAGDFGDFNYSIQPVSIAPLSPAEKIGFIMQTLNAVGPFLPMAMQQGMMLDLPQLVRTITKLRNVSELNDIFKTGAPVIDPTQQPQGMPPVTRREYVRINKPGATRQGQDETMFQQMMGGNPQPAEAAQLTRSAG